VRFIQDTVLGLPSSERTHAREQLDGVDPAAVLLSEASPPRPRRPLSHDCFTGLRCCVR